VFTYVSGVGASGNVYVYIRDSAGTEVQLTNSLSGTGFARIVFNKSAKTCDWYEAGTTLTTDNVDLSTLNSTSWYIKFKILTGFSASTLDVHFVGYAAASNSGSSFVLTSAHTASSSTTMGIGKYTMGLGSLSNFQVSADGGSNFSTATNKALSRIGTAGTSIQWKLTADWVTSIDVTTKNIPTLNSFSYYFG
jgi:hypothetical protein